MRRLLSTVLLVLPLAAQRVPDPIDSAREIGVFDANAALDAIGAVRGKLVDVPALGNEPETPTILALHRRDRLDDMVAFLRAALEPRLSQPDDLQRLGNDLLVLRGSPEQQGALQGLLRHWAARRDLAVTVSTRVVAVPGPVFDESLAPLLGHAGSAGKTATHTVLGGDDVARWEAALSKHADTEVLVPPRLLLLPGQQGTLSLVETVRYRKDYEVESEGTETTLWPITDTVQDGVSIAVRAAPVDQRSTALVVDVTRTDLVRPIPTFETDLGIRGQKVVIDLPELTVRRLSEVLHLQREQLGIVVSAPDKDATRTLLLVRCEVARRD